MTELNADQTLAEMLDVVAVTIDGEQYVKLSHAKLVGDAAEKLMDRITELNSIIKELQARPKVDTWAQDARDQELRDNFVGDGQWPR